MRGTDGYTQTPSLKYVNPDVTPSRIFNARGNVAFATGIAKGVR